LAEEQPFNVGHRRGFVGVEDLIDLLDDFRVARVEILLCRRRQFGKAAIKAPTADVVAKSEKPNKGQLDEFWTQAKAVYPDKTANAEIAAEVNTVGRGLYGDNWHWSQASAEQLGCVLEQMRSNKANTQS
jgi:hypothetical protein